MNSDKHQTFRKWSISTKKQIGTKNKHFQTHNKQFQVLILNRKSANAEAKYPFSTAYNLLN